MKSAGAVGRLVRLGGMFLAVAILALALPSMASAMDIYVDGNDGTADPANTAGVDCGDEAASQQRCNTIQRGVDEAADAGGGDQNVIVEPNTYNESVTITQSGLSLIGAQAGIPGTRLGPSDTPSPFSESIVTPPSGQLAFDATGAGGVTISGFSVVDESASGSMVGGAITGAPTVIDNVLKDNTVGVLPGLESAIHDNAFYGNTAGVFLNGGSIDRTTISNNAFQGNTAEGIDLSDATGAVDATDVAIQDNTSSGDQVFADVAGLNDDSGQGSVIQRNTVTNTVGDGLVVRGSRGLLVQRNSFDFAGADAIHVAPSNSTGTNDRLQILGNQMTNNVGNGLEVDSGSLTSRVGPDLNVHYNRIPGSLGEGILNDENNEVDAENNFFGCNGGPNAAGCDSTRDDSGTLDTNPWLRFGVSAAHNPVGPPGSTAVRGSFLTNSAGQKPAAVGTFFPSTPVAFTESGVGSLSASSANTTGGVATVTDSSSSAGNSTVRGTADAATDTELVHFVTPSLPSGGGSGGAHVINGTSGNDHINGTPGDDVINCGGGNDVVNGGGGNDVINCGAGNDVIHGGAGNDVIHGGAGNDSINGEGGNDSISGDSGNDRVSGGAGRDRISGGAGKDRLGGDGGNDRLSGGSGKDALFGGAGKDSLSGGSANDSIGGGSGNDRATGGAGNDRISGSGGKDKLSGGSGNDRLSGGPGRDRLSGGSGKDRLSGGSGNDRLSGGPGRDRLIGGSGRDTLIQ